VNLESVSGRRAVKLFVLTAVVLEVAGGHLSAAEYVSRSEKDKDERRAVRPTTRGVTDASALSVTTVTIPRLMDGPTNEFTESLQQRELRIPTRKLLYT
jgi:hypothetical protein